MARYTGAYSVNVTPAGKSPTTGLDFAGEYRPILVQISNAREARPHGNLSEADIVYESIYAFNYTRYTAVFSDNHPSLVGSVHSARLHHCELREEWDCPMVFWGGQETPGVNVYEFFRANGVAGSFCVDGTRNPDKIPYDALFARDTARVSPHNVTVNLRKLAENVWPAKPDGASYAPKSHAFRFSDTPTRGQDTAQAIYIPYDAGDYFPSYTFNPATRQYERWYNGEEQYDGITGKRIEASNVIVQVCRLERFPDPPECLAIATTKGGMMDAFIDGQRIRGAWVRDNLSDRTIFLDGKGNELTLLPGKTFIQIVPEGFGYTYMSAEGMEHRAEW